MRPQIEEGAHRAPQHAQKQRRNASLGSEWRVSPEAVEAAKAKAEEYLKTLGEQSARNCAAARRSTLKAEDVREPAAASSSSAPDPSGMM